MDAMEIQAQAAACEQRLKRRLAHGVGTWPLACAPVTPGGEDADIAAVIEMLRQGSGQREEQHSSSSSKRTRYAHLAERNAEVRRLQRHWPRGGTKHAKAEARSNWP